MIITLTGFMGCGKSTVGKLLSRLLPGHTLTDLDCYIEQKSGKKRGFPKENFSPIMLLL